MNNKNLHPSEDFYFNDQGYMVFTEAYHLKRGYCCKSGCKHCPYKSNIEKDKLKINTNQHKKT